MGAANALAAYRLYAGKIPQTSLSVLVYMALVAKDHDSEPAYWDGHETIAIRCLGYPDPAPDAGMRAVRRAITPLFRAGGITVDRHSCGHGSRYVTARYRLWLAQPAPDGKRPVDNQAIGRKVVSHRTKSGQPQDGNRPPKEKKEEKERVIDGAVFSRTLEGARARDPEAERRRQLDGLTALMRQQPVDIVSYANNRDNA